MNTTEEIKSRYSITFEVIRYVTLYYFSIAILLTVFQVVFEYFDAKKNIDSNIQELITSFDVSLSNSLWEFNDNQTKAILTGISKSPSVIGVLLKGNNGEVIQKINYDEDFNKRLSPNSFLTIFNPKGLFLFEKKLLKKVDNDTFEQVGVLHIYSGNKIILEYLSRIIFYIIINSIVKTISLWAIMIIIFNRKVKAPLDEFVHKISSIDSQNPKPVETNNVYETEEIYRIQHSFNNLIKELKKFKDVLEAIVDNKTELLKEKNIEVRQLVSKLEHAQSQIINQEKLNSLGLVSAGIAHELKNPLNLSKNSVIIIKDLFNLNNNNHLDMSLIDPKKLETLPNIIKLLYESNQRMESIITNMLLQSRAEYTKPTKVNLFSFIDTNMRVVQKSLNTNISCSTKTLIDVDHKIDIEIFPSEFGRLLVNLFENSFFAISEKCENLKAAPEKFSPELRVTGKMIGNSKIVLSFFDNGIGIPEKIKNKILEPFFTTKPAGLGTGLGLYLTYEIIKKHKGEITINSEERVYTEIQITLPIELEK